MKPHPHTRCMLRASWRRVIAVLLMLLAAYPTQRASAGPAPPDGRTGSLIFCIEQHPGKGDYFTAKLSGSGVFLLYGSPETLRGDLPGPQSRRILEAFEALCTTSGLEFTLPTPRRGMALVRRQPPYICYESPGGRVLHLAGPDAPPPAPVIDFVRTLWHKLQYQMSKKSEATSAPVGFPFLTVPIGIRGQAPPALR